MSWASRRRNEPLERIRADARSKGSRRAPLPNAPPTLEELGIKKYALGHKRPSFWTAYQEVRTDKITGLAEQTLRLHASMAGQFELLTRINNLSYQHHREVASIKLIATDEGGGDHGAASRYAPELCERFVTV